MDLTGVRDDVAVIDELLRIIAKRPVDMDDPDWMAKLRAAPPPVEEAGVAAEAAAALEVLLDAYEAGDERGREEVRQLLRDHRAFRWGVGLPREWSTAAEFRRRLVLVSACDQGDDPRDELMTIWALCNRARELHRLRKSVAPVANELGLDLAALDVLRKRGSLPGVDPAQLPNLWDDAQLPVEHTLAGETLAAAQRLDDDRPRLGRRRALRHPGHRGGLQRPGGGRARTLRAGARQRRDRAVGM